MFNLTLKNGTNKRFQLHYMTNTNPQRCAFVEIEPGATAVVVEGEEDQLREIVSQNEIYGMVRAGEEEGPAITYTIADGEVEGVDTIRRKLYNQEADVHVHAPGKQAAPPV